MVKRVVGTAERVLRAKRGDVQAFEDLVAAHLDMVCAVALSICGNIEQSEDVAQDAFLAAWKKRAELEHAERFSGWMRQIAKNTALNAVRSDTRRRRWEAQAVPKAPDVARQDDVLTDRQRDERIAQAFAMLNPPDRHVLIARYRHDLQGDELAAHLAIDRSAARQRLARARRRVQAHLEEPLADWLQRSRPGVALVATIVAALRPNTASAHGARTASWAVPTVLLTMLVPVLFVAWNAREDKPLPAVDIVQRVGQTPAAAVHPMFTTEATATEDTTPAEQPQSAFYLHSTRIPADYPYHDAPNDGEPPVPMTPAAQQTSTWAALAAMPAATAASGSESEEQAWLSLLEVARAEGCSADSPDWLMSPQTALVALEVERVLAEYQFTLRRAEHYEGFSLELPLADVQRINSTAPKRERRALSYYAAQARDTFPDHPLAAYFLTYELLALVDSFGDSYDAAAASERLQAILVSEVPEEVTRAAILHTATPSMSHALSTELRHQVATFVPRLSTHNQIRVLPHLASAALAEGRFDEATRLITTAREVVQSQCPAWPTHAFPPTGSSDLCPLWTQQVDLVAGQASAMTGRSAPHWRPQLIAVSVLCLMQEPLPEPSGATFTFDDHWESDAWNDGSVHACVSAGLSGVRSGVPGAVLDVTYVP